MLFVNYMFSVGLILFPLTVGYRFRGNNNFLNITSVSLTLAYVLTGTIVFNILHVFVTLLCHSENGIAGCTLCCSSVLEVFNI